MAQAGKETRITRLLDWTEDDKAWFLSLVTVPLHLLYLLWGWFSLEHTQFGVRFMDPAVSKQAWLYALGAAFFWVLMSLWGTVLRRLERSSSLYVNIVIFSFGLTQLPLAYASGLAGPMTGVILLGATMTGFVLFSYWRVLAAFFVSLAVLIALSVMTVRDLLPYAPMFRTDPISQVYVSPYYATSQFMLGVPFVTSAFVISYMLLTRWRRREAQTERLATTDALTGVANRRALGEALGHAWLRALRHQQSMALVMVDLDYFKHINDSHGHDMGDRVLVQVAKALRDCVREIDLVGRMGGEEFVLLLPETGEEAARQVAERCRAAVARIRLGLADGGSLSVTASFGICALPASRLQSAERYLSLADDALYQAKSAGRNRVVVYRDPAMAS